MSLSAAVEKFNNSKFKEYAEKAFSSYVFPFVTAVITVISTTFGLEPLIVWYICICGAAISLCCKDISPVICLFVFMHIIISMKHSPDQRGVEWCDPTYLSSTAFVAQTSVAVLLFAGAAVFRIVTSIIKRRFKLTPIFFGICAYFVGLALSGVFSNKYYYMDTLYGLGMGAILLFMFVYISGNVVVDEHTYKRIAVTFLAFSIALAMQLIVAYITLEVVQEGVIDRSAILFGWGSYNQFGMAITMCIPAWFYLALKSKYGCTYLFGVIFNIAVVILSMSRQAILMSGALTLVCCIWYLIAAEKMQKILGGTIMIASMLAALIVVLVRRDDLAFAFKELAASFSTGSGRIAIWKDGLKKFLHNPIFGNGFYDMTATGNHAPGYYGEGSGFTQAVPFMCHNTFVQLLFACGIVGTATYIVHRVQTAISLFKNPSAGRIFIALTACGILLTSLLDNHIFYPLPLFIYAPLLAVFTVSEGKTEAKKEEPQKVENDTELPDCPANMS